MYKYYVYGDFPTNTETVRHICTVNMERKAIEIVGAKYIVKTRGEVSLRRFEPNADYSLTDDMTFALTKFRMPDGTEYENWPEVSCVFRTGCVFASRIPEGHTIVEPHEFESFEAALEAQPYEVPDVKTPPAKKRLDEDIIYDEAVPKAPPRVVKKIAPPKVQKKMVKDDTSPDYKELPEVILAARILGSSQSKDDKIQRVKQMLEDVENVRGKENKINAAKTLMNQLTEFTLLLGQFPGFRNTVIAKMHELLHDSSFDLIWKTGFCESVRHCCKTILDLPTNYFEYSTEYDLYGENAAKYEKLARAFLKNMYKNFRVISRKEFAPGATVSLRCNLDWNRDVPFTGTNMTIYVENPSTFAFRFIVDGAPRCSVNYNKVYDVETGAATNNGF